MLTGAIAALALAAPVADAKPPKNTFVVKTAPHNSARTHFAQYLSAFHVGAGEDAVVGTTDFTKATVFYISETTGLLTAYEPTLNLPPSVIGLENFAPYNSSAPAGYDYVSQNIGAKGTKGWVVIPNPDTGKGQVLVYEGDSQHGAGPAVKSFALCHVKGVSPYQSVGPQYQFLWEGPATVAKYKDCADVQLEAIEVRSPA